jgi:long-chain fatty acid transport protein
MAFQQRLTLFVLAFLAVSPAHATGLYELTGSHGSLLPFSARVAPGDASLAYFNPALLPRVEPGFGMAFFGLGQLLDIGYEPRTDGLDITAKIYDARLKLDDGTTQRLVYRPLATADLRKARGSADPDALGGYVSMGTVVHFIPRKLALGLHATIPVSEFQAQQAYFADHREQFFSNSLQFELLGDRTRVNIITGALAWQAFPWLSVGAGVTMTTRGSVQSDVYVADVTYQETAEINANLGIELAFVPHFSLAVEPVTDLLISASVHLPYESSVKGRSELQMWNYPYQEGKDSLSQVFSFTYGYEPLRAVLGASWRHPLGDGKALSLAGWARYANWSKYQNRHGERPRDTWRDTVSANLGVTLLARGHEFGLEGGFVPSPVPQQTGMDNYVDNHRAVAAMGWDMPVAFADRTYHLGLFAQAQYLIPRSHTKDLSSANPVLDEFPDHTVDIQAGQVIAEAQGLQTNNPGYPGYDHSGWVLGAGFFFKSAF